MFNSKFTVAIHLLTLIAAQNNGKECASCDAAESANTNPVVARRILGKLRKADIVESKPGRGGGWQLARSPGKITLKDIYHAIENNEHMFAMHHNSPSKDCLVGKHISSALTKHYDQAEAAMINELSLITIQDVLREVKQAEKNN